VDLVLRFRPWAFLRSEQLADVYPRGNAEQRADYPLLFAAYAEIWNKLAGQDVDGLMPLFEERSRENDEAFYLPIGTTQAKLRKQFEQELAEPSRKLGAIAITPKTQWMYDPGPAGKLRRMVFGSRNGAIIRFVDKEDPTYMTQFPISFRKEAGRYIVSR
jgi:hypothetical protein